MITRLINDLRLNQKRFHTNWKLQKTLECTRRPQTSKPQAGTLSVQLFVYINTCPEHRPTPWSITPNNHSSPLHRTPFRRHFHIKKNPQKIHPNYEFITTFKATLPCWLPVPEDAILSSTVTSYETRWSLLPVSPQDPPLARWLGKSFPNPAYDWLGACPCWGWGWPASQSELTQDGDQRPHN